MSERIKRIITIDIIVAALIIIPVSLIIYHIGYERGENNNIHYVYDEPEIDKCPMCGKDVKINPIDDVWYIKCDIMNGGCGLQTGYYEDKYTLINTWNDIK